MSTWREELAWAAGFFDGEGYVGNNIGNPSTRARSISVSINQISREPLDRFRTAVFGIGKVYGPYQRKQQNASPIHNYQAIGFEKVQAIFAALWPFLSSVKKSQYRNCLPRITCGIYVGARRSCSRGHPYAEGSFKVMRGKGRVCLICRRLYDTHRRPEHQKRRKERGWK